MGSELAVVVVALFDRFVLRRNAVKIVNISKMKDSELVRFSLGFKSSQAITSGTVTYSLRNKKRPVAIVSKSRPLDFSKSGLNLEYLTFSREKLEKEAGEHLEGTWVLDVKIERSCSRLNPLYKIFPTVARHQEEFHIE
ncbi:hypothetical protein [Vibrio marisflavi]|uniref:Uncharacterized protein n=1 Tax=Vibrio marisflavi CECT 7928 TaxID=634439 RepID=A0ABM9A9X0_9VIBR|nr:hypothetical protein [Vibrio marisflavi]CAH0543094.1 hypothetical protein VMF7928_04397 [Vibrio marisflavi CECT 7928]